MNFSKILMGLALLTAPLTAYGKLINFAPKQGFVQEYDKILKNNSLVVVDFWGNNCPPCKFMSPIIYKLSNKYTNITFVKINIGIKSKYQSFGKKFGINSIPTFKFFKDGKEVGQQNGSMGINEFETLFASPTYAILTPFNFPTVSCIVKRSLKA